MTCHLVSAKPLSEPVLENFYISIQWMHLKVSGKWSPFCSGFNELTHWGQVTHICIWNLTIIGLDNDLSPCRRRVIIWTSAGIFVNWTVRYKFQWSRDTFLLKKMHLEIPSGKWQPFCLGLNVLMNSTGIYNWWTHKLCQWTLQTNTICVYIN